MKAAWKIKRLTQWIGKIKRGVFFGPFVSPEKNRFFHGLVPSISQREKGSENPTGDVGCVPGRDPTSHGAAFSPRGGARWALRVASGARSAIG